MCFYIFKTGEFVMIVRSLNLSYEQMGIFYGCLNGISSEYNVSGVVELKNVKNDALSNALQAVVKEQEMLRTCINETDGEPRLEIHDSVECRVGYVDMTGKPDDEITDKLNSFKNETIDLYTPGLLKITEFKISSEISYIAIRVHHIIVDGMSMNIFMNDILKYYYSILDNNEPEIKIDKGYSLHIENQKKTAGGKSYLKKQKNWREHLHDAQSVNFFLNSKSTKSKICRQKEFLIPNDIVKKVKQLSAENEVTEYSFYLAVFYVLFEKYTHSDDLIITAPFANRSLFETAKTIGCFASEMPLRLKLEKREHFSDIIRDVFKEILFAYKNIGYPNYMIADDNFDEISKNNIWDITFVFDVYDRNTEKIDISMVNTGQATSFGKFTVYLTNNVGGDYFINMCYREDSIPSDEVTCLGEHYINILNCVVENSEISLEDIKILSEQEKKKILNEFNNTNSNYAADKTVSELFEEQVEKTPEKTALVYKDKSITYKELNSSANIIAHKLRTLGVKNNDSVVIISERKIEMLAAILGAVKSGGAYVPVDPTYPAERIRFIIEDCSPKAVIRYTTEEIEISSEIPVIDLADEASRNGNTENPEIINKPEDILYCIYTSGTTGNPKGVLQTNRTIVNLVAYEYKTMGAEIFEKTLFATNYAFDVSVQEYFSTLLCGGTGCIITLEDKQDVSECLRIINKEKIRTLFATPSYFDFLSSEDPDILAENIKDAVLAGESFKVSGTLLETEAASEMRLHNHYGPTETHVVTTKQGTVAELREKKMLNLGIPVANTKIYILDGENLCGIGVPGELCIAGDGVARGYLNRPDLTEERFVDNLYGEGKMYRTGDLARWLPDGTIDYLGRIDEQVKIRGFRIELGEIESRINEISVIKDCAVIARDDKNGDKAIYAYYTGETEISVSEIRDSLSKLLPEYMVPAYMMQIEKIPVTRNGKLDKRALPEIEARVTKEYEAPRNDTEKIICNIFSEILGVIQVGIKDSFFELGGHSLRATRLVNRIEAETGKRIALKDVFIHSTPEELAKIAGECDGEYEQIPKAEEKEYYPMSSAQKRVFIIQQMNPESTAYNMPATLKITGKVYPEKMKKALQDMMNRHEILRTQFMLIGGEPVQKVLEYAEAEFEYIQSNDSDERIISDYLKPFALDVLPLVRMKVVNKGEYNLMMVDMHHIVSDGMSINTFISEFLSLYIGHKLKPLSRQFRDYSEWMRTRDMRSQSEYWKSQFDDEIPVLDMPTDYPRPHKQSYSGDVIEVTLSKEKTHQIKKLSGTTGSTEYMFFLTSLMIVLSKYSRQEDIVIGSPISGRTHKDTETMLGMFANTLAMRGRPEAEKSFTVFLDEIKQICLNAYENQEYPFEELIETVDIRRDISRNPLFDVMMAMQNNENVCISMDGIDIKNVENDSAGAKFDLTFDISEENEQYIISMTYSTALYKKTSADMIMRHFTQVLDSVSENHNQIIRDITTVSEEEKDIILCQFNSDEPICYEEETLNEIFRRKSEEHADNTALVFENRRVNYRELNVMTNSLAFRLRELGVKADDFVAVIADRSIEMIAAIMAVIKSGGAYVPIDPGYPAERISFMLNDCSPKAVLIYSDTNPEISSGIPVIDLCEKENWEGHAEEPECINKPEDLIYCIYTSGTTGTPKGVMIENRSVVNLCMNFMCRNYADDITRVALVASYAFDSSVKMIFSALISGKTLHIISEECRRDAEKLLEYFKNNEIQVTDCTPTHLKMFMNYHPEYKLKNIYSGGEKLSPDITHQMISGNYCEAIYNVYGPTECTVDATCSLISGVSEEITIGKPIANVRVYIMDNNVLCGAGVPGELCIAGAGISRGYLNRPNLTAEKFVENPYGEGKMYRTGDLVRWLPDGNIEYLGRIDEQVKIRGFRIELGEIESRIREIDNISDCAVVARTSEDGDNAIYAYHTAKTRISVSEIRDRLSEVLPEYMVPSYIMQIEKIPVTRNGKLDNKALPQIEACVTREYTAPTNETEAMICKIFSEILGVKQVGIKDGFFELGGHSLRATRMMNRIEAETGVRIPLKEVFVHSTPEQLAKLITESDCGKYVPIPKAEEKEYYPMSSAQKRTYIIQSMEPESTAYNMPANLKITGKMYPEKMKQALQQMVNRHEILRTQFLLIDGEPVQKVLESAEAEFEFEQSCQTDEKIISEYINPFVLDKPSLVRMKVVDKGEYHLLMVDMHHIVSDGMSVNTFVSEFLVLYSGQQLEPLNRQFRDYSEWMRIRDMSKQEEYWKSQFDEEPSVLDIPTDYPRQQIQSYAGAISEIVLSKEKTEQIKILSGKTGTTEYMVFLAAFMIVLSKYSRQEDIVIGSPISGRTHKDTETMLGMFVNTLAMRGKPEKDKSFADFLNEIKHICLDAYENQEYPFEELVEAVGATRDVSRNPLFDVMMTMQNNEDTVIGLEEINVELLESETVTAKFDLSVDIFDNAGCYCISMEYCSDLFTEATATRILTHLEHVLTIVFSDTDKKIGAIEVLTDEEREKILNQFNNPEDKHPENKTIIEIFEEQAAKTPDNTAVISENRSLTYSELNQKANCIAFKLRETGIEPDDCVVIISDRSIEMIQAIYGTLKSGAAYVPIDPTYPAERIGYIINDCIPKAIIRYTQEEINLPDNIPVINLENSELSENKIVNPEHVCNGNNLAYCIYTSGTTGKSKGVMVKNNNLSSYVKQFCEYFKINDQTTILQQAYIGFDTSVEELYPVLMCGGKIVVVSRETLIDTNELKNVINRYGINIISSSPMLINAIEDLEDTPVRILISGGDVLKEEYIRKILDSDIAVYNTYGPTEATVCVTYYKVEHCNKNIPIGKPISGAEVYILDGDSMCGIGIPGEICIGGNGVTAGYINRPELTSEKFVENPYGKGKMYRTGDLARWLPDGNIEYLGRIDEQVKIRGFRIELGEIESRIREIEGIQDCTVIARDDRSGEKSIFAYFTCENKLEISYIRNQLKESLPGYMIPPYIMQIDNIPFTRSGKVDKRALPEIENTGFSEYVAPENSTEQKLADIYCEVLSCDRISVLDNFFDIGGNSLKLIKIFNKINEVYPSAVRLVDIFSHPTISSMAEFINKKISETERVQIKPMEFSSDMFDVSENNEDDDEFRVEMSREVSEAINKFVSDEDCTLADLMTAALAFVLGRLYSNNEVVIQCISDPSSDKVTQMDMNFENAENFFDIVNIVKTSFDNSGNMYSTEDYVRFIREDRFESVPLFVCGNISYDYMKNFDIVFGFTHDETISLVCRFNNEVISSKEMYSVMEQFAQMVEYLADSE